jgi:hypothetical protein
MRAWIVTLAALFTVIGIGSPRVAGRSGHLLLVTIGLVVAVVTVQPVFAAIEQRRAESFIPGPPRTPRATMPNQMAEIVEAFTNRTTHDGDVVPSQLIRRITSSANGRLVDHHHLYLGNADDHDAIRRLVSPTLWALLRPADPATRTPAPVPSVTFDRLDELLDELERL